MPRFAPPVADGALVIPKEVLHHDAAGDWVFRLEGDHVARRAVKTGNSTVTQVQVTAGLARAMPSPCPPMCRSPMVCA